MPSGATIKAGIVREATTFSRVWPSASPGTVLQLLPIVNESVNEALDQQMLVQKDTRSTPNIAKLIRQSVSGTFAVNMQYEGLEFLITAALGHQANRINGVLMPEDIDSGVVFRHLIELDQDLTSAGWTAGEGFIAGASPIGDNLVAGQRKMRRFTYAILKGATVWEALSCMIPNFTMSFAPQGVTASAGVVGHSVNLEGTVNANISNLDCDINRVLFQDTKFFVKEADASELVDPDDLLTISGFEFSVANNLQAINTKDTGVRIEEPQRGGPAVVTGSFAVPQFQDLVLQKIYHANGFARMKLESEGTIIPGSTERFRLRVWFPLVQFTGSAVAVTGPGKITQNYSFMAFPGVAPGFPASSFNGPVMIELVNTNGEHPLLD